MWRSILFIPVLEERFIAKALQRDADALVLDLEASIAPQRKHEARQALAGVVERLSGQGTDILVRINTCWRAAFQDLETVAIEGVTTIMLADCRQAAEVIAIDGMLSDLERERGLPLDGIGLLPIVESAGGVLNARDIAAHKRVCGLTLGIEDYVADLESTLDPATIQHAAMQVVQAARAAGVEPFVIPESLANLKDLEQFRAAAQAGRDMGSRGGFAVHPAQVEIINDVFTPTDEDLRAAQRVVDAAKAAEAAGLGAVQLDGRMIDLPIIKRAARLLEKAGRPTPESAA